MNTGDDIQIEILTQTEFSSAKYDFNQAIYDLDGELDLLSSHSIMS